MPNLKSVAQGMAALWHLVRKRTLLIYLSYIPIYLRGALKIKTITESVRKLRTIEKIYLILCFTCLFACLILASVFLYLLASSVILFYDH